jgi:hypothetical protein
MIDLLNMDFGVIFPQPPKRTCLYTGCTTPLAQSNDGILCYRHTQMEIDREIARDSLSERGDRRCGHGDCMLYTAGAYIKYCYVHAKRQSAEPELYTEPPKRRGRGLTKLPPMSARPDEQLQGVA